MHSENTTLPEHWIFIQSNYTVTKVPTVQTNKGTSNQSNNQNYEAIFLFNRRLAAKKHSLFTFSGFKEFRLSVTMFPAALKTLSLATLVACTHKYFLARTARLGNEAWFARHHSKGSPSLSFSLGSVVYRQISLSVTTSSVIAQQHCPLDQQVLLINSQWKTWPSVALLHVLHWELDL